MPRVIGLQLRKRFIPSCIAPSTLHCNLKRTLSGRSFVFVILERRKLQCGAQVIINVKEINYIIFRNARELNSQVLAW